MKRHQVSLLVWINVVLTFLFMQIGVPLVVYLVMTLALPPWGGFLVREPPYCWCFLAIGAVLGFGSATYGASDPPADAPATA